MLTDIQIAQATEMSPISEIAKTLEGVTEVVFIPYAAVTFSYDEYERRVQNRFNEIGIKVRSVHHALNKRNFVRHAQAIVIGGGNTFGTFYRIKKHGFLEPLKRYIESGVTYIGGSAGVHIVSRSTKHVLPYDPDRNHTEDYTALGYFDGIVICHFSKEREAHYKALKAEGEFKVYTLTNDQAIVIDE